MHFGIIIYCHKILFTVGIAFVRASFGDSKPLYATGWHYLSLQAYSTRLLNSFRRSGCWTLSTTPNPTRISHPAHIRTQGLFSMLPVLHLFHCPTDHVQLESHKNSTSAVFADKRLLCSLTNQLTCCKISQDIALIPIINIGRFLFM